MAITRTFSLHCDIDGTATPESIAKMLRETATVIEQTGNAHNVLRNGVRFGVTESGPLGELLAQDYQKSA